MLIKKLRKTALKFIAKKIRKSYGSVGGFYQYHEIPLSKDSYFYSRYEDLAEGQRYLIEDDDIKIFALEKKVLDRLKQEKKYAS